MFCVELKILKRHCTAGHYITTVAACETISYVSKSCVTAPLLSASFAAVCASSAC